MKLGRTGLEVNQIGFGGLPIKNLEREQAIDVVRHAFKKGINFFDTSRAYGMSERYIGDALSFFGLDSRELYVLSTKTLARTPEEIRNDLQKSILEFRTHYIDLFGLHKVGSVKELDTFANNGGMETLMLLKAMGVVNYIYLSSHRLDVLAHAIEKYPEFDVVMFPLNVVEVRTWKGLIQCAREKNIGMIGMKPFGGGVISDKKLALTWLLHFYSDVLIIPGIKSKDEIDANLRWAEEYFKNGLTIEERGELMRFAIKEEGRLRNTFCHRCEYCVPVCPNGINPSWIIQLWDIMNYRDGWESVKPVHIEFVKAALNCTLCGRCKEACPYELPLTELVTKNAARLRDKFIELGLWKEDG